LERELIVFVDGRGRGNTSEFRAVELLISNHELQEGLKSNSVCPVIISSLLFPICLPPFPSMHTLCSTLPVWDVKFEQIICPTYVEERRYAFIVS
jgi:hypothetical protein